MARVEAPENNSMAFKDHKEDFVSIKLWDLFKMNGKLQLFFHFL